MSIILVAVREPAAVADAGPKDAATWVSAPMAAQTAVAFASLVDLVRLQFGSSSVSICDVCNTVNLGHAHYCKGCSHKLPAYYVACEEGAEPPHRTIGTAEASSLTDFAAFALVVNLLVGVVGFLPIQ